MAIEIPGQVVTVPASADLSAFQFRFVTIDNSGELAMPTTGASVYGVLQNKPDAQGIAASVMTNGISKMTAPASTVAVGEIITTSTDGEPVPLSAGDHAVGRVVRGSSGGAGRFLSIQIEPIGTT